MASARTRLACRYSYFTTYRKIRNTTRTFIVREANSCLNNNHIRPYMHTWTTSCEALLSLLMWSQLETTFTAGARRGISTSTVANATTLPTRYGTQGPISPLRITTVSFELKQNCTFFAHDQ